MDLGPVVMILADFFGAKKKNLYTSHIFLGDHVWLNVFTHEK